MVGGCPKVEPPACPVRLVFTSVLPEHVDVTRMKHFDNRSPRQVASLI